MIHFSGGIDVRIYAPLPMSFHPIDQFAACLAPFDRTDELRVELSAFLKISVQIEVPDMLDQFIL